MANRTKGAKKPKASALRRTRRGERMVVYLPTEIATELRIQCARERRSLSDAVTNAIEVWASVKGRLR